MHANIGIALGLVAMICWGFGDFAMQRSIRRLGDWETLFVLTFFGAIIIYPFVGRDVAMLNARVDASYFILIGTALILMAATLLTFEGFKHGKISVLEPLFSFEIPAASVLAFAVLNDHISWLQAAVIAVLTIGLFLVSFREKTVSKKMFLEKGVAIFFVGAILTGFADFLLGWGSRTTNPLLATFVLNLIIAALSLIYILIRRQGGDLLANMRSGTKLLLVMRSWRTSPGSPMPRR